jgi:DNA invertase Pin-like site-specific DNA recombinase
LSNGLISGVTNNAAMPSRVSTDRQGQSGLGIEAQRKAVLDFLNGGNWKLAEEFVEVESGKRNNRLQLAAALAACKRLKARRVVAKLDRLARNVAFISKLMERGVEFVAADMPFANKLTIHILAAVAEHEPRSYSARTKAALAAAKARGVKLGGPKLKQAQRWDVASNKANADRFAANVPPIIQQIKASGATSLCHCCQGAQRARHCDGSRRRLAASASDCGAASGAPTKIAVV